MRIEDLGPEEQSIIAAARGEREPTPEQRSRVRNGLNAKLAAGVTVPLLASGSALAAVPKIAIGVALALTFGVVGVYVSSTRLAPTTRPPLSAPVVRSSAPSEHHEASPPPAATVEPPDADVREEAAPAAIRALGMVRRRDAGPAHASDLGGEIDLLTKAGEAIKHGDTDHAASLLRAYDRRYSAGRLAEERAATGVLLHCAAGQNQMAAVEARRFIQRWPHSPLVARIQTSCALEMKAP